MTRSRARDGGLPTALTAEYYAQRAITIHETLDDRLSLARSENNLGLVLIRRGDLVDAEGHLERANVLFDESGVEVGKADALAPRDRLVRAGWHGDGVTA